jgi:hypothetical protein
MQSNIFTTFGDATAIFEYAEGFFEAYFMLSTDSDDARQMRVMWARMTLAAFVSELYLKCILSIENGKAPKGHYLHDLYMKISPATRSKLNGKWDAIMLSCAASYDRFEKDSGGKMPRDLGSCLKEGNKGFEILRYAYEPGNAGFGFFLNELPIALRRTILEMQPTWGKQDAIPV